MTTITVVKGADGKLTGSGEKGKKDYARFKEHVEQMEPGEFFEMDYYFPRNPELEGWHNIVVTAVFEAQEQFSSELWFREWLKVGAGHCEFVPGPRGRMVAIAKSTSRKKMDDADYAEHHEKVMEFFRSPECTRVLWGHLSDAEQSNMIEAILSECEAERQRIRAQRGKPVTG